MSEAPDLSDPNVVHLNMLCGTIAKPSWEQIKHLYPEQFAPSACREALLQAITNADRTYSEGGDKNHLTAAFIAHIADSIAALSAAQSSGEAEPIARISKLCGIVDAALAHPSPVADCREALDVRHLVEGIIDAAFNETNSPVKMPRAKGDRRELMVEILADQIRSALASVSEPPKVKNERAVVIEECARVADHAAKHCVREQIAGDSVATSIANQIRSLIPEAKQP